MVRSLEDWNFLCQRNLRQAERNKLHERPQITGAVARQIIGGHPSCQQRHNAPFPIADRLYRALRWTTQVGLPWLLLGLLVCAPVVSAQVTGFDRHPVEIFGTVFLEGANRPMGDIIANIRSITGGPFDSVLTDWSGHSQVRGLDPGMYEIVVEEPGYEPVRETLRLYRTSPPLELHLRESNSSPVRRTDFTVSVREKATPRGQAWLPLSKGLSTSAANLPYRKSPGSKPRAVSLCQKRFPSDSHYLR